MNLVQHYNDLTEINGLRYQPYVAPGQERPSLAKALAQCEAQIKTRIAFTDVKTSYPESMRLIDNIGRDWLKSPIYPERYLTLIRLDRKRTPEEIAKMRYYKYRIVFTSDVARYFANGWRHEDHVDDDIYGTKEKEFWASKDSPKIDGFKYEPAV